MHLDAGALESCVKACRISFSVESDVVEVSEGNGCFDSMGVEVLGIKFRSTATTVFFGCVSSLS